jgi:peptidoglycan/LPS O-acetylase OafA/YrhL
MEIRKLNTLRGIAALIVVVSHYFNETNLLNELLGFGAGQIGVMLFFILSGFLMSHLYMNKDFGQKEVGKFINARIARVIPLYFIVVFASYFLYTAGIEGILYNIPNEKILITHISLMAGTSILWTIPAEIQFYIIFIFLWWILQKRSGSLYILLAMAFLAIDFADFPVIQGNIFGLHFPIYLIKSLPYFFIGVIFGQLYKFWRPPASLSSGAFVLSLLIIPLLFPRIFFTVVGHYHRMWHDVGVLFAISLVFFFIVFFVPDKNVLMSNRIGDFLGKISYSLYLLHLPVLSQLAKPAQESPWIFLAVFLIASTGVAYLSYLLFESPARKAIRSFASNNRLRPSKVPAD